MPTPSAGLSIRLPSLVSARAERAPRPSRLEEEVTALFDELHHPVFRYLLSLGLPAEDGEEVVQETFLALFQHLLRGKPRSNLRGWVFRVAHNLALKRRRANHGNLRVFVPCGETSGQGLDPTPSPEEQALHRQRQQRLLAAVRALPEQDRNCLHLRAEGLRYREIAKVLGMSLGAVSLSLHRSLARLSRACGR